MSVIYNEHVTGLHFEEQQKRTKKHKNERKTRNEDNDADGGCIDMCFLWEDPHVSSQLSEHADASIKVRAPISHIQSN